MAADLLSLIPGGSSPAKEAGSEATGWELVLITQSVQPSSTREDSNPSPQEPKQVEGGGHFGAYSIGNKGLSSCPPSVEEKEGEVPESCWSRGGGLYFVGSSNIPSLPGQGRRRGGRGRYVQLGSQFCCSEAEERCYP